MSYRNKTYVIFDGDNDHWAFGFMKGWKQNDHVDFDFHDAHDINVITDASAETNTKKKLRERFSSAKQAVVLIGNSTKNLYRFVRWELDVALDLDIPIVCVNLNKKRVYDSELCPPILRNKPIIHVSFNAAIIKYALDNWPSIYPARKRDGLFNRHYSEQIYKTLGL